MQIKISVLKHSNCPPAQRGAVMPPDRRALEPGLRFSHPSVTPHLGESEKRNSSHKYVHVTAHTGKKCTRRRTKDHFPKMWRIRICVFVIIKTNWERVCLCVADEIYFRAQSKWKREPPSLTLFIFFSNLSIYLNTAIFSYSGFLYCKTETALNTHTIFLLQ